MATTRTIKKRAPAITDLNAIQLKIASPEDILSWSFGEVIKPETINYRTQRPEKDGLFSERIFGPTKDWECYCGKYRRIRYKGIICDKCNVEVTRSVVRRERMGHINLAAPVAHIWFFKNIPSKMSLFLNIQLPKLERVIYYAAYIVTAVDEEKKIAALEQIQKEFKDRKKNIKSEDVELSDLKDSMTATKKEVEALAPGHVISESEYHNLAARFGDVFDAGIGAEAIRKILKEIDLKKYKKAIEKEIERDKVDSARQVRNLKRLKMLSSMIAHKMRPEWMVMTVLPVMPPDLRPMVALDGGRYATSDLNDLYRRVINRNNRLKKLMDLKAPEVIIINEKRMLQEAVDALIDNSARGGSQQMNSQRRPLRSISDMLKGKQGRFRQNLLGKRVDYSGRSVIVVGPELKLHQCGLPKKMALELFRPFVIAQIIERGLAHNVKNSNRLIDNQGPEVWEILEEVIKNRKVLLNRAPTLHRLGIQAFEPQLIEDFAIRLHPMVCPAFNADFDGDQMAVHLPLSQEAQREASEIMLSSVNLLKPATGDPIVVPAQDIVLGVYYLTRISKKGKGSGKVFSSANEVRLAYQKGIIDVNSQIVLFNAKLGGRIETTVGRIIFNAVLPETIEFVNEELNKKKLMKIVGKIIDELGAGEAPKYLDEIKRIGFKYATVSGITWSMDDLIIPKEKDKIMEEAGKKAHEVRDQFNQGLLTDTERKARVTSIWVEAKDQIAKLVPDTLDKEGSVYSIVNSGARGSWTQITQVTGTKGLVQNSQNEMIELPIKSSFKEGFNVLEYFIATHGARKGTTDTALKTAQAGYLTRKLVDVSQDLVIRETDCKTKKGVTLYRKDSEGLDHGYADRLFGRTALEDIKSGNKVFIKASEIIDQKTAKEIDLAELDEVQVRSPITCKAIFGICIRCYGFDLGRNKPVEKGEAVGVVAAQSIGEPGTQLTMRTFHIGGVAGADITHGLPRVVEIFEVRPPKGKAFVAMEDGVVTDIENKNLIKLVKVRAEGSTKKEKPIEYAIPNSNELFVNIGDEVKKGDRLCEGSLDLREIFEARGREDVQRLIVKGVQQVYSSEGASINDKHIEVIARQMFSRVKIQDSGDSDLIRGEIIEKSRFKGINNELKKAGKNPAKAKQLLMGITKVALSTESFLSSASFQETARVLINAAVDGRTDELKGLKENVIIGRTIPVGKNYKGDQYFNDDDPDAPKVASE
ncbi:MAG: DNA-directed RNA polymerase subunit beta' [bacterium]|nr:DNA-directed RNA polymerase subunit beta' [bacterium]